MALTADLVASAAQVVEDAGLVPGMVEMTDEDYRLAVQNVLPRATDGAFWFFGYGSLLWNAACGVAESRGAMVHGWHRAFCIRINRFRGTLDGPGLMMALDRGGLCRGAVFRVAAAQVEESLDRLFRREILMKPWVYVPRWLTAQTGTGPVRALGFVVNRSSERYVGKLSLDEVAAILATAAGHRGSCAEYLHNTVAHLDDLGIRDRNLWRLQGLVAERLKANLSSPSRATAHVS
jgi:glutathione-specific gamma-glutamylcyclotransferase